MQKKEIFQVIIFFSQFNWELDIGQNCIFRIFLIQCLSKIIDRQHEDQRSKVLRITEINTGLYSVCAKSLQSCLTLYDTVDYRPARLLCPWDSPERSIGVHCHAHLQESFPTQDPTRLSYDLCMAGWLFTISATWEASERLYIFKIIWG